MTRSILSGLLGLLSVVAMASLPAACESGGVGDPCLPEEEYDSAFAGFKVTQEFIESRSFQCETRICLVNHFQGRVSCPLGQPALTLQPCTPGDPTACNGDKDACVPSSTVPRGCNEETGEGGCDTYVCRPKDENGKFIECQDPNQSAEWNKGKICCVPGTDAPVQQPVCGQCGPSSTRNAEQAVYCSCRCGLAEGDKGGDQDFNFCTCPQGFECKEIRTNIGLDQNITGKFCIKEGSRFTGEAQCGGLVEGGYYSPEQCKGTPTAE